MPISHHYDELQQVCGLNYIGMEYFYQRDLTGNINYIIDKQGKVIVQYSYTAFGVPSKVNGSLLTCEEESIANVLMEHNIYLYKGYCYDEETGLYYLVARYYDPEIGRFISVDGVSYLDPSSVSGLNLFAYCYNNPISYADPSGNFPILIALAAAFVIAAGSSAISQGIQYGWNEISLVQVGVDGLFAVASVALAATGIGFWASVGIGAVMGLGQYAIASGLHDEQMTWQGALLAVGIGAAVGALSGAGARNFKSIANALDEQQIAKRE